MTLTDTGPLVALINSKDPNYARCLPGLSHLTQPLCTTWPCFTEAMYLLGRSSGLPGQQALWRMRADGLLTLHQPFARETDRMEALMAQYHDLPMDLADASVVAAAETLGQRRVFTLDRHFHAYRLQDKAALEVYP